MTSRPLDGYTIGVTADRRADEQIKLLAGRGGDCLHGPAIKTHPLGNEEALGAVTDDLLAQPPDLVVLTTGLGVRGWLEAAEASQRGEALRRLLSAVPLYSRGPKTTGALATAGFDIAWRAPRARYDDVVDELAARGVTGARVAVQLDGAGAAGLCHQIEALGAGVVRVPVYRWSLPEDTTAAERLVRATVEGRVDALTFTAKPAVENFLEIAGFAGLLDEVAEALSGRVAAFCVGPVCAAGFADHPAVTPLVPERHRLGAMVQQLTEHFGRQGDDVELAGVTLRVQGRLVMMEGGPTVSLTDRERVLLRVLLERPGAVLSKRELLSRVWRGAESDEHLVEVTVARLRRRLGPAAGGIETVMRRGYRLSCR